MAQRPNLHQSTLADRYRIERELGAGGMATVYLAHDVRHDRKVAVKVLKPELAAVLGAERFLNEIKVTANLQHPHILPLHDSGEAEGFLYYVMPYVEGESVRARLDREKQLPIEEALRITTAVASALDYAHRQGVIHRDIKPENILLHDGQPVVADFGIALAVSAAGGSRLTETGLSLGTPQYMSPEQATGDLVLDGRSDIYSLGCVLYEMFAGEPPHTGPTVQAVITKVVAEGPQLITEIRDTVPNHVAAALHKALAKLPADRFANASRFGNALSETAPMPSLVAVGSAAASAHRVSGSIVKRSWAFWAAPLVIASLAGAAIWGWVRPISRVADSPGVSRLVIPVPADHQFVANDRVTPPMAVSPDGTMLVYAGRTEGAQQLYLRRMDRFEATAIPGTVGAGLPFFSPDGEWLGFLVDGALYKLRLSEGTPQKIADVGSPLWGASWGVNDTIVFGDFESRGIWQVAAVGGQPEQLTDADDVRGELAHMLPQFLPDGSAVLFTAVNVGSQFRTALLSLPERDFTLLPEEAAGIGARYLSTGHLLVGRSGELLAVPFDAARGDALGAPISVLRGVYTNDFNHPLFAVAEGGSLVYVSGAGDSRLVWVDRRGTGTSLAVEARRYRRPRLSPDGRRVAVEDHSGSPQLWVLDLQGRATRVTTIGGNSYPVWSPDGVWIAFGSDRDGVGRIYLKRADGSGPPLLLSQIPGNANPWSWSKDGNLALEVRTDTQAENIWVLPLAGDSTPVPLLTATASEEAPMFSPDGRWLAYVSDESGQYEVFVIPYPGPGDRIAISAGGGRAPVWSRDGKELFYRQGDRLYVVALDAGESLRPGEPQLLFEDRFERNPGPNPNYDVAPDGSRFLMIRREEQKDPTLFRVVLGWTNELMERIGR
jgi:serine/threonine-protein kinase